MSDKRTDIQQAYIATRFSRPQTSHPFSLSALLRLFCVGICIALIVQWIVALIGMGTATQFTYKSFDVFLHSKWFWILVLFLTLVGPLLEEILFRLWLRPTYRWVHISIATIITYTLAPFIAWWLLWFVVLRWVAFICAYLLLMHVKDLVAVIGNFLSRYRRRIFVLQALIFGWLHVLNYTTLSPWRLWIVLVLPQTILGSILWFERLHWNWWVALLHHILHNTFLFAPFIFLYSMGYDIAALLQSAGDMSWLALSSTAQWMLSIYMLLYLVIISVGMRYLASFFIVLRGGWK